jgi:hypothetical protein
MLKLVNSTVSGPERAGSDLDMPLGGLGPPFSLAKMQSSLSLPWPQTGGDSEMIKWVHCK